LAATAQLVLDAVAEGLAAELTHTASAPAALVSIAHDPGLSIERLSLALGLTHSGTVRLIDRLEDDGLVRRHKTGARTLRLGLTARGRRAVTRIERARIAAVGELLAVLPADRQRQLDAILAELLAARTHGLDDLHRICRLCSFEACEGGGQACPVAEAVR
jgi:DNA-binding MarR family transcriptional regulator